MDSGNVWQRAMSARHGRRRLLRGGALGVAGLGAAWLAACGGGNNNSGTTSTGGTSATSAPATSAAASASAAPTTAAAISTSAPTAGNFKTGGTIQLAFTGTTALDPYENSSFRTQDVVGFTYSRLFRFNSGPDPNISLTRIPVPDLAESYEVADGVTYTMKLRQNATFHPPLSRPATSADVVASYQRFTTDTKNTNSGVYAPIVDSISAPDDHTVQFKLKEPYAPFTNKLANPQYLWIMSKDAVDGKIDPSQQVIGTGPWIFVSSTPTAFTYKKNPDYFIKGIPYADGAVLNIIPDTSTQEAQFQAGKLDVLAVPASDVNSVKGQVPKAVVVDYIGNLLAFLFFTDVNAPDSPFKDERMRRAASLALDRPGLLDLVYNSQGGWDNIINPGLGKWWLDPQGKDIGDAGQWFKHDPKQAKQLIDAAGQTNTEFKFIYPNNAYGDVYNSASDAIRGMLSDAGFKLQVVTVDYLKDYINNGQGIFFKGAPANSIVHALQTPFTDPDDYLSGMLTPKGNRNHENVNDAALTNAVAAQRIETDPNKRLQLVYQVQKMADTSMWYPPTVNGKTFSFQQPWVQSFFVADDYGYGTESIAYISLNR